MGAEIVELSAQRERMKKEKAHVVAELKVKRRKLARIKKIFLYIKQTII